MPRQSETGNVTKICGCAKWKEYAHPWYVDYREGKEIDPQTGKVRERGLRKRLGPLVGRYTRFALCASCSPCDSVRLRCRGANARPRGIPTSAQDLAFARVRREGLCVGREPAALRNASGPFALEALGAQRGQWSRS
jgi:hypothetical protein